MVSLSSAQKLARNRLDCCQAQAVDLNCYLGLLRPAEHLPRNRKGRDRFRAPGCFDATNHQIKRARQNSQIEWERKRDRREKKKTPTNEESEKHGEMKSRRLFFGGFDWTRYRRIGTPPRAGGGLTLGSSASLSLVSPSNPSALVSRCR